MKPHKWAKEIKAWADGGEIEARTKIDNLTFTDWMPRPNPQWETGNNVEFRIKPQPKEPQYLYVYFTGLAEVSLSTLDNLNQYELLGKIRLEVEDEVDDE